MKADRRPRRAFLWIAGFVILVCLIVVMQQFWTYSRELEVLYAVNDELERTVQKGRAVASNREKLVSELRAYDLDVKRIREMFPEHLDVDGFYSDFVDVAARHSVTVEAGEPQIQHLDFFDSASISIELTGSAADVQKLFEIFEGRSLFVKVEAGATVDGLTNASLTLFAITAPEEKKPPGYQPCEKIFSAVWLPPYRGMVRRLHERRADLCNEAQSLAEEINLVEELKNRRADLRKLITVANELHPNEKREAPQGTVSVTGGRLS